MSGGVVIVMSVLGVGIAALNIAFWWWVVRAAETRFKPWVERRYGVTIGRGYRGHWEVHAPERSWAWRLGVELLQLAWFMGAFVVWGVGLGIALLVMNGVESLLVGE